MSAYFHSQQTLAGMQVSSAILFRVSPFNRFIIEKALLHIVNMESTSPVKSPLSKGNCPFPPLVAGMVTLQFFQNCVPGISMVFPLCFLVNKNSFRTDITCNLTRHCGLPLL